MLSVKVKKIDVLEKIYLNAAIIKDRVSFGGGFEETLAPRPLPSVFAGAGFAGSGFARTGRRGNRLRGSSVFWRNTENSKLDQHKLMVFGSKKNYGKK